MRSALADVGGLDADAGRIDDPEVVAYPGRYTAPSLVFDGPTGQPAAAAVAAVLLDRGGTLWRAAMPAPFT
jgi:hypothetical protein